MPHSYNVNSAALSEALTRTINSFGFTSTHEGKALGMLLADETVEGIAIRSIDKQCDGSGRPWPKNSDATRRRKYKEWGEALVNKDTGQMLSVKSLKGKVTVTQFLVVIEYGTNEPSSDAAPRGRVTTGGRGEGRALAEQVTDVDKAVYAHAQGRGFFELDDEICDKNFAKFSAALKAHLAKPG